MKTLFKKWAQNEFIRQTGVMLVGFQLMNFFNLVFHLIMVRVLTYAEYGTLNALVVLSFYFCQFNPPFQPALARALSRFVTLKEWGKARYLIGRSSRDLGLFSLAVFAFFVIWARPLAAQQQISEPGYMVLVGLLIAAGIMLSVPQAFLQGAQLFTSLSSISALSALLKVLIAIALVWAGYGISGGLWGFIASPVFVIIAGYWLSRRYFRTVGFGAGQARRIPLAPIYKYYLPTSAALLAFTVLTNADITLVKKFFPPQEAGYYSVAQLVGKIILFLPWAVSMVVFPKAASAQTENQDTFFYLKRGLFLTALLTGAGTLICGFFPEFVLEILAGKADPGTSGLVFLFALAMSLYSLVWLVVFYNLSLHNTRFLKYIIGAAVLQTAAITLYHPTLKSVLAILTACAALTFFIVLSVSRTSVRLSRMSREVI